MCIFFHHTLYCYIAYPLQYTAYGHDRETNSKNNSRKQLNQVRQNCHKHAKPIKSPPYSKTIFFMRDNYKNYNEIRGEKSPERLCSDCSTQLTLTFVCCICKNVAMPFRTRFLTPRIVPFELNMLETVVAACACTSRYPAKLSSS